MRADRLFLRLEPARPAGDPQRGFEAELADPAWMLGRQWQMGEHQGENASSPLEVSLETYHVPIEPLPARPGADPAVVPAEAIVEAGDDDWWTIGRRARLGLAARHAGLVDGLPPAADAALRFAGLTGAYAALNGVAYDGQAIHVRHPNDPIFADVPPRTTDLWDPDALAYQAAFPCGGAELAVGGVDGGPAGRWGGHDGGDVDWWSVDATAAPEPPTSANLHQAQTRWPERFRWPGSPAARWWQIEDHTVDLGGLPPDRAHFATTLLLDMLCGHADDWFVVPLGARAGHVLGVERVTITDSFGETWPDVPDPWRPAGDWSVFRVDGMPLRQLPIWSIAMHPLAGEPIDEVTLGIDEDANLAWAVEERIDGVLTRRARPTLAPPRVLAEEASGPDPAYRYTPATAVPDHWYPYTREERGSEPRFVQGRLISVADDGQPVVSALPTSRFLELEAPRPHAIAPWRLPPTGVRLESRTILARSTTGEPVLWVQRRRTALVSVPASGLRFDALLPSGSST